MSRLAHTTAGRPDRRGSDEHRRPAHHECDRCSRRLRPDRDGICKCVCGRVTLASTTR